MPSQMFDRRAIPASAETGIWTAPDRWRLRRIDWRQPKGRTVRGSLLFAAGRGDFIEKYLEVQQHWFALGWNVTSFDWRGQGASRGSGKPADSFEAMVGDLEALASDWLSGSPGPHVAIGHSMGGHLLMRVLAERTLRVDAAVLVAPMLGINSAPLPAAAASATAALMTTIGMGSHPAWHQPAGPQPYGSLRQSILTGCEERYDDELYWWKREPGYNLGAPSWAWLHAAYQSSGKLTPARMAKVEVPILLLGAEKDRLVSADAIRRAAAELPHAELVMLPDAAHELLRESDAIRVPVLERIDAFLDAHAAK